MRFVGVILLLVGLAMFIVYGLLFLIIVWDIPGVKELIFALVGLTIMFVGFKIQ